LTNTGYYTSYSWANPALDTLERFIILPITGDSPIELGVVQEMEESVIARFKNSPMYQEMFKKAFPNINNPFTIEFFVKALAAFNRTLVSFNSPYDQYLRGDTEALNASQKRGMNLFMGEKAECFHCHDGIRFSDSTADEKSFNVDKFFHNIGLYNVDGTGSYPLGNQGLFEITSIATDKGKFKAPTLRNVELTFPYMHDGSMETLEEVIELHSNGGRNITTGERSGDGRKSPYLSDLISAKEFTEQEKQDLVAFLKALTDQEFISNPKLSNPFVK
jgi:cytochrome c peroxidase